MLDRTTAMHAISLPDQTAACITGELVKIFSIFGHPEILHSDQGRNFESSILAQTLQAFGVHKSRTTAYHPQGDGMVERFNRSLLQLLRAYVDTQSDWEQYLPLVLYAYRTSIHSSTGVSPFLLMYGHNPSSPFFKSNKFDSLIPCTSPSQNCTISLKQTWQKQYTIRNMRMISTYRYTHFVWGILFDSLLPRLENLNPGGREIGSSNLSKVQQVWKSQRARTQKLFACNIAMF